MRELTRPSYPTMTLSTNNDQQRKHLELRDLIKLHTAGSIVVKAAQTCHDVILANDSNGSDPLDENKEAKCLNHELNQIIDRLKSLIILVNPGDSLLGRTGLPAQHNNPKSEEVPMISAALVDAATTQMQHNPNVTIWDADSAKQKTTKGSSYRSCIVCYPFENRVQYLGQLGNRNVDCQLEYLINDQGATEPSIYLRMFSPNPSETTPDGSQPRHPPERCWKLDTSKVTLVHEILAPASLPHHIFQRLPEALQSVTGEIIQHEKLLQISLYYDKEEPTVTGLNQQCPMGDQDSDLQKVWSDSGLIAGHAWLKILVLADNDILEELNQES